MSGRSLTLRLPSRQLSPASGRGGAVLALGEKVAGEAGRMRCEACQGRNPPLGKLQDVVGEADEAPLSGDLLDAAQEELTEAARLLDLSKHRFGSCFLRR